MLPGAGCPWGWVSRGHPTTLWDACAVRGAVWALELGAPSRPVEGAARSQPGSPSCPPPPVAHPRHVREVMTVGGGHPQESSGRPAGTLSPGRRPSDTLFIAQLNHVLSPPLECQSLLGNQLPGVRPRQAPPLKLEAPPSPEAPRFLAGHLGCGSTGRAGSGPAQALGSCSPRLKFGLRSTLPKQAFFVHSFVRSFIDSADVFQALRARRCWGHRDRQGAACPRPPELSSLARGEGRKHGVARAVPGREAPGAQ